MDRHNEHHPSPPFTTLITSLEPSRPSTISAKVERGGILSRRPLTRKPNPMDEIDCRTRMSDTRSEEHTSELQSLMRISYAVFCLKKKQETTRNMILMKIHLHDH